MGLLKSVPLSEAEGNGEKVVNSKINNEYLSQI